MSVLAFINRIVAQVQEEMLTSIHKRLSSISILVKQSFAIEQCKFGIVSKETNELN